MADYYDHPEPMSGPPCPPGQHKFAVNGTCWYCHWTRAQVIAHARATLEVELELGGYRGRHRAAT